jgi:hypothetical protein
MLMIVARPQILGFISLLLVFTLSGVMVIVGLGRMAVTFYDLTWPGVLLLLLQLCWALGAISCRLLPGWSHGDVELFRRLLLVLSVVFALFVLVGGLAISFTRSGGTSLEILSEIWLDPSIRMLLRAWCFGFFFLPVMRVFVRLLINFASSSGTADAA